MQRDEIIRWLREPDEQRLQELWERADAVRRECVGDEVHLRGLIEVSNYCARDCHYCGLRRANRQIEHYRMTDDEVMDCVREAVRFGYGTVVLQSGEDYGITQEAMADLVRRIKAETPLAVTLSLGERSDADLATWRAAGADRYLLRFETSNRALYDHIHPPLRRPHPRGIDRRSRVGAPGAEPRRAVEGDDWRPGGALGDRLPRRGNRRDGDRMTLLGRLREMGYEVGSGALVGIPGQTYDDVAADVEWFATLDLDMIGVGPFIPHPRTPLGGAAAEYDEKTPPATPSAGVEQAPNSELMTYKVLALARLACPYANIPSTTALATLNQANGRELGLARGANIVMPNLTPPQYRVKYEIYPGKACVHETAGQCHGCLSNRISRMGRSIGTGRGDSPNRRRRLGGEGVGR